MSPNLPPWDSHEQRICLGMCLGTVPREHFSSNSGCTWRLPWGWQSHTERGSGFLRCLVPLQERCGGGAQAGVRLRRSEPTEAAPFPPGPARDSLCLSSSPSLCSMLKARPHTETTLKCGETPWALPSTCPSPSWVTLRHVPHGF